MPPRRPLQNRAAADVSRNLKTGLILVSVVLLFFAGVIVRHWLWP
jgi:Cu/Ag efflux pump CusA